MKSASRIILGASALGAFVVAAAGDPSIDLARSSLTATFRQENVPVDEPFKSFSGHIDYDPMHPAAARASIVVQTGSLDMGSADYDAEVRKKDWLDSAAYPNATFVSTAITPGAAGHLTATGTLSLKGKTETLSVPVSVTRSGSTTVFDGALQISRQYFGIGSAEWNDVIDDKVDVRFHILE